MVKFLALMHKITFTTKQKSQNKELVMTQYLLKLLTILSNILVSNLQLLDEQQTDLYVTEII